MVDTTFENRIRRKLRTMDMETCEYVYGVLVERLLCGRGYKYIINGRRLNLDQAVYEVKQKGSEFT